MTSGARNLLCNLVASSCHLWHDLLQLLSEAGFALLGSAPCKRSSSQRRRGVRCWSRRS